MPPRSVASPHTQRPGRKGQAVIISSISIDIKSVTATFIRVETRRKGEGAGAGRCASCARDSRASVAT